MKKGGQGVRFRRLLGGRLLRFLDFTPRSTNETTNLVELVEAWPGGVAREVGLAEDGLCGDGRGRREQARLRHHDDDQRRRQQQQPRDDDHQPDLFSLSCCCWREVMSLTVFSKYDSKTFKYKKGGGGSKEIEIENDE